MSEQKPDVDVLGEGARADGFSQPRAELLSLIADRQVLTRHCREDPADEFGEGEWSRIPHARVVDGVAGRHETSTVRLLALLVGAAAGGERRAEPVLQESGEGGGPRGVLSPEWNAIGHDRDASALPQQRTHRGEQARMIHPVQCLADGDARERSDELGNGRDVMIGTKNPGGVVLVAGSGSRLSEHVRLWVQPHHRAYPPGKGQRQLAGAAAHVQHHVVRTEVERLRQRVDGLVGISAPEPLIQLGDLATESECRHAARVPYPTPSAKPFSRRQRTRGALRGSEAPHRPPARRQCPAPSGAQWICSTHRGGG